MEKKKLRIAFLNITQGLIERGAEIFVSELSVRLKNNHEVWVEGGNRVPPLRWPILWRLFIDPNGLSILWWTIARVPLLLREKFDVVIPVNGGWQPAIVRIVTWLYGGKIIISGHSGMGWDDRNNLWCFPDAFVALSSKARDWAKNVNPLVKVRYIPNGVDLERFTLQGTKFKTRLQHPIILCVGALTPGKRIDLVIHAVAKLSGASLLVVGDGELRAEINNLGKSLLNQRFQLIKLPYGELPSVYRTADIFSLVSEPYYSFELVLLEAMATNLPVVANDDPIRREIVGDAGLFVDPIKVDEYSAALKKALVMEWGDKPRKQVEKFSWDKIAEQYEKLFRDLRN